MYKLNILLPDSHKMYSEFLPHTFKRDPSIPSTALYSTQALKWEDFLSVGQRQDLHL